MPKNKGKYRSQLPGETPSEALQSLTLRIFSAVRPHLVKVGMGIGGGLIVLTAWSAYSAYRAKQEEAATKLYGEATEILRAQIVPVAEAPKEGEPSLPPQPPEDDAAPSYTTVKARGEAALAKLGGLGRSYGGTGVAKEARLLEAGILYDLERFDEAIALLKKFGEKAGTGHAVYAAREMLGYAVEAKALTQKDAAARESGLAEALAFYEKIQPSENGFYRDHALFHQARIKATRGDKAGAIALYKQILEKSPKTALKQEIATRLSMLEEPQ